MIATILCGLQGKRGENIRHYVSRVKATLSNFKFNEITEEQLACTIASVGIKSPNEESLRSHKLQKVDADNANVKFDGVINDCINFIAMKADSELFISNDANLNVVQH